MMNEGVNEMSLVGHSIGELTSVKFSEMRKTRVSESGAKYVVWFELTETGNLVELDTDSVEHSKTLIDAWLGHDTDMRFLTASYRKVKTDGSLGKCEEIIDKDFDYLDLDF
jgi:hypothetical protein